MANEMTRCGRKAYSSSQHGRDIHLSLFHANYSGYCDSPKTTRVTETMPWLLYTKDRHLQMFHFEDSPTRKAEQNGVPEIP
jgi:hypothetical protein